MLPETRKSLASLTREGVAFGRHPRLLPVIEETLFSASCVHVRLSEQDQSVGHNICTATEGFQTLARIQ